MLNTDNNDVIKFGPTSPRKGPYFLKNRLFPAKCD